MNDLITNELKNKIASAAKEAYPNEMCGFVIGDDFFVVENISQTPKDSFEISHIAQTEFAPRCKFFIHSHPDGWACPSKKDMEQQRITDIPWGFIATDGKAVSEINFLGDSLPIHDLELRPFVHGITDCWSAIRDWYKLKRNVQLKDFPRSWRWWHENEDMYMDNLEKAGFEFYSLEKMKKEGPKEGDLFLVNLDRRGPKLNHAGVYLGNGLGYHHTTGDKPVDLSRPAKIEPVERWMKYIHLWARYAENDPSTR